MDKISHFLCFIITFADRFYANMKKSTIWIVSIMMGLSFLALLFLQLDYFNDMVQMKREQFEENVSRALFYASRKLELDETLNYLEKDLQESEEIKNKNDKNNNPKDNSISINNIWTNKKVEMRPVSGPKFKIFDKKSGDPITTEDFQEQVRYRYVYQKTLLNEVVHTILHTADNKPLEERIDFKKFDNNIKTSLAYNGVDLKYHFMVFTSDGREVYRCGDWDKQGSEYAFSQMIFRNAPVNKMGVVKIHFPDINKYIFSGIDFMIPSLLFTLLLLITFIFTIIVIFRQKRVNEMRNDFISNMTHELKTPVSSISLAAQMLGDKDVAKNKTVIANVSKVIKDESSRLRMLIDKVLQMSMFERSKDAVLKKKELDINQLITNVVETFRLKVEYGGGRIELNLNATKPEIYGDEMHLTNVIFNLMDNAVKYKKEKENLLLKLSTRNNDKHLIVSVEDNGMGIKKDQTKKIFEKFYRVHTGNVHNVKGFGLGLAYVKNIITAHDGTISAESDLGKGTKFIIKFPLLTDKE